jgi:hypothetical protein
LGAAGVRIAHRLSTREARGKLLVILPLFFGVPHLKTPFNQIDDLN